MASTGRINTVSEAEARADLAELLRGAVALYVRRLGPLTPRQREAFVPHSWAAMIGRADAMLFASKDRALSAQVLDTYARGLAVAAFAPGGVPLFGAHWCVEAHPGCPNEWTNERMHEPVAIAAVLAEVHRLWDELAALAVADCLAAAA